METTSLLSRLHIEICRNPDTSPTTPEVREDLILRVLNQHPEGMGFNHLQKQTGIPRKTLNKYVHEMKKEDKIKIEKLGERSNSDLVITIRFSDEIKKVIERNLKVTTQQHWFLYKTKIQKANAFPHYLQQLSAEYCQYMVYRLFCNSALYKFALNRLEEHLDEERNKLEKTFDKKTLHRIAESCDEISFNLFTAASSAMTNAGMRNLYRTSEEIWMDMIHTPQLILPQLEEDLESDDMLDESRINLIKDKEKRKEYLKLLDEYNELSSKLTNMRYRLASISGVYPFKQAYPVNPTSQKV